MPVSIEQWTEYGIGQFVFLLRFYCRWRVVGIRNFAWDDFFSFIAMLMWISDTVTVQIISDHGAFVGLTTETANALTDEEVHNMEIGSKALFVAWLSYVTLIWSLKASVLCFYSRLTLGLWQQKFVRILVYPVILTYLASILTLFLHCTPIQKNWQIKPFAGDKCTLFVANYIVVIIGNVSTDLAILYIPLPMIWAVKIPLRRKIAISILLSSGIFVITAAILRCVLSLKDVTEVSASTIWGIRETFISLLAISAAAIKPYFSRSRWTGGSSQYLSGKNTNGGDTTTGKLDRSDLKKGSVKISSFNNDHDDDRGRFGNSSWQDTDASHSDIELGLSTMNEAPSRHGSDDNIVSTPDIMSGKFPRDHSSISNNSSWLAGSDKKKASLDKSGTSRPMEIQVTTTFIHDESGVNTPLSPQPTLRQPAEMWSPQHSGNTTMVSSSGRR